MASLFKPPAAPPAPVPLPPTPMPDPYNPATLDAAQRAIAARPGRNSTMLTTAANTIAGGAGTAAPFAATKLGP